MLLVGLLFGIMLTAWTQKDLIKSLRIKHALLQSEVEQLIAQLDEHGKKLGDEEWAVELRNTKDLIKSKIGSSR